MKNIASTGHLEKCIPKMHPPTERTSCHYWCPQSSSCLLVSDGIFIPLPHHVAEYCHSVKFRTCPHYRQLVSDSGISDNDRGNVVNQRRAKRIAKYLDFQFSKIRQGNLLPSTQYETAWTTDINGYGVSFVSKKYVSPDTRLRFLIEENAVIPVTDGFGKVVWCKSLPDTSYFQTGLEFSMLCS